MGNCLETNSEIVLYVKIISINLNIYNAVLVILIITLFVFFKPIKVMKPVLNVKN